MIPILYTEQITYFKNFRGGGLEIFQTTCINKTSYLFGVLIGNPIFMEVNEVYFLIIINIFSLLK
jgi:hypothetical protein